MHGRIRTSSLLTLSIAGWLAIACDREPTPPVLPPTTRPATVEKTGAATKPVIYKKLDSIFVVSTEGYPNQQITLPPASLVITPREDQFHITLRSNDPPEADKEGFTGNRFNFDFTLDPGDEVAGSSFTFQNNRAEETDEKSGIFLQGGRQIVRPENVTIKIEGENDQFKVTVSGMFELVTDNPDQKATQSVIVTSQLEPEVIHEKE